jgi:hypothetical protein
MRSTSFNCLLLALFVSLLAACRTPPPEQRLRAQIQQMQLSIEQRRPKDVLAGVAEDFVGNAGMDRAGLAAMLRGQLMLHADINVIIGPLDIDLNHSHAQVAFTVMVTGGAAGRLPASGRLQAVRSHWREVDGRWLLYSAQWKDASS